MSYRVVSYLTNPVYWLHLPPSLILFSCIQFSFHCSIFYIPTPASQSQESAPPPQRSLRFIPKASRLKSGFVGYSNRQYIVHPLLLSEKKKHTETHLWKIRWIRARQPPWRPRNFNGPSLIRLRRRAWDRPTRKWRRRLLLLALVFCTWQSREPTFDLT